MAKEGPKGKGNEIKDGFNLDNIGGLTKRELAAVKRQAKLALKKEPDDEAGLLRAELGEKEGDSAHNMLVDMRWAYKKVKGRKKLKELIETDDKQFVVMVKELMRLESLVLAAKLRREGDGQGTQAVFVVLKGLDQAEVGEESDVIDVNQIRGAISPGGVESVRTHKE